MGSQLAMNPREPQFSIFVSATHNFKALPWLVVTNKFLVTVSLIVHICYLVSHLAGFLAIIMFTTFQKEADASNS